MSEDQVSENASAPETPEAAPRVRRISNPRPKKTAAKTAAKGEAKAAVETPAPAAAPASEPSDAPTAATVTEAQASQDWPDAETVSDNSGKGGADKRKRRRRKGKGGGQNAQSSPATAEETISLAEGVPAATEGGATLPAPAVQTSTAPQQQPQHQQRPPQQQNQHNHQQQQRQPVSPELVAKRAWKIYLAEVSEEGVSLISDQDARELSKRCFRLAELFLEEQGRRTR